MDLRNANFDPYTGQQLRPLPPDFPYGNRSMPTAVRTVQHPGRGNARSTAGSIAFWSAVVFDVVAWGILCLFAMFWLTGELPLASAFENSRTYIEEPPFAETIATDYYRNTLSGEDLKAYDEMEYALRTMSTMKVIDAKIPDQERIQYLFSCVKADNPDIFWCSVNWRCYQSNAGNFILEINYLYDDPE